MKLIDFFFAKSTEDPGASCGPMRPDKALSAAFEKLTGGNPKIAGEIISCQSDTAGYFAVRSDILDRHGLKYSQEAEPWLRVIAAVEAAVTEGFLCELGSDCTASRFAAGVQSVLSAVGIPFSLKNLLFDAQKSPVEWSELFNEYAGQSGITLYFIDLYGDGLVMGAARIADYAEAAEDAAYAGLKITSCPG